MRREGKKYMDIDLDNLMDLRVDFAFKLLFTLGEQVLLISLLNAIFENKGIPRVVKSLRVMNPYLEKESEKDKLSILDIKATLDDGSSVLIEMHMYELEEIKAKTIRSWARIYGGELQEGERYTEQSPTISIAFTNGRVKSMESEKEDSERIHRLCMIMDREEHTVFTDAMELHYINMEAFVKAANAGVNTTEKEMFIKWLLIITQKAIKDKKIIEDICKEESELEMAIRALARYSDDEQTKLEYLKRKDDIYFHNKILQDKSDQIKYEKCRAEQAELRAEQEQRRAEQEQRRAEQAEAENEKLRQQLAALQNK